jgi:hypothetical protein
MKMTCWRFIAAVVVSSVLVATQHCNAERATVEARLTDKLGVESQFVLSHISYGKTPPVPFGNDEWNFQVEVGEGCYVVIPPTAFKEARLENNRHNITLSDGTKVNGILMGDLIERGPKENPHGGDHRRYALKSCKVLTLQVANAGKTQPTSKQKPTDKWQLVHPNEQVASYVLVHPQFNFYIDFSFEKIESVGFNQYAKLWVTEERFRNSQSFVINVAGEKMTATIRDFAEVSLKPGKPPEITLITAGGVKSSGELILKDGDNVAKKWAFVGDIDGPNGTRLILTSPQCTIRKMAEPGAPEVRGPAAGSRPVGP